MGWRKSYGLVTQENEVYKKGFVEKALKAFEASPHLRGASKENSSTNLMLWRNLLTAKETVLPQFPPDLPRHKNTLTIPSP